MGDWTIPAKARPWPGSETHFVSEGQGRQQCVFAYHEVLPLTSPYLYRVTSAQFQKHLALLSCGTLQSSPDGQPPVITFDDGHRSNFEHAFPLLDQYGAKAVFFILAGHVGRSEEYLSWDQARQLIAAGHRVESHGWSHRLLTHCSPSDLENELIWSKKELEDRLGVEISAISTPGGRWDERVKDACADAGYKYLFHSNPWIRAASQGGFCLQGRHTITGRTGPKEIQKLMQVGAARRLCCLLGYGLKDRVRGILGDSLYHKAWCWLANWKPEEGMELKVNGFINGKARSENP